MKLVQYLAQLNSSETNCGIWINPNDIDDYRIGENQYENGGIDDNFVYIGSLESLSFAFQSVTEIIESFYGEFKYNGRTVRFETEALCEAYFDGRLADDFYKALTDEIEDIGSQWAIEQAEDFIEDLIHSLGE